MHECGWYERRGKRLLDVWAAMLLLAVAVPVLAAAALGVLCCLGRPVLFRQLRTGQGGHPFVLLKLRSLRDRPGDDAARLGRFGRALRTSAIDELPQLINVLRGQMSLVGPRPLLPDYLPRFTPTQQVRLRVRPGLCGLAQAAGRNAVPWDRRLALDGQYATARPTLPGDLRIMARCAWVVLRGEGVSAPGHATMPAFPEQELVEPSQDVSGRAGGLAGLPSRSFPARSVVAPALSPHPADA